MRPPAARARRKVRADAPLRVTIIWSTTVHRNLKRETIQEDGNFVWIGVPLLRRRKVGDAYAQDDTGEGQLRMAKS